MKNKVLKVDEKENCSRQFVRIYQQPQRNSSSSSSSSMQNSKSQNVAVTFFLFYAHVEVAAMQFEKELIRKGQILCTVWCSTILNSELEIFVHAKVLR
jgi:hypothetical protein